MKGFLYYSAYNNIVETLHMDAAPGRIANGDANSCGNSLAAASRDAKATPELFMAAARQFLATAGARTCSVVCSDPSWQDGELGFLTRRFEDHLYVTTAGAEERVAPGMRIAAVGKNTVPFLLKDIGCDIFGGRGSDREDWDLAMRMFDDIDVVTEDGHVQRLDLRRYPRAEVAPTFSAEQIDPTTLVLTIGAMDAARIASLLDEVSIQLAGVRKLIVDLRNCQGDGDAASWALLLPYLCDKTISARDVMGDRTFFTIYSKNNADRLISLVEAARIATGESEEELADAIEQDVRDKAAKVLQAKRATMDLQERRAISEVPETVFSPFEDDAIVEMPDTAPEQVVLLVDTTTGLGAERLAQAVMGMDKVRLVGRATPGAIDYANYLAVDYPDIFARFIYPASRSLENHDGHGYARCGLPLDVHVPFEPRECTEDTIMQRALALA